MTKAVFTRIEVRFLGKKVPILHLSEYARLSDLNLFDHLKARYISIKKFESLRANYSNKRINRFALFLDEVKREGIHSARRTFNRNRDFSRSIEPILNECSFDLCLSERWRRKMKFRIIGDLDLDKYLKIKVCNEEENEKNKSR